MPAQSRKRVQDYTGTQAQKLATERDAAAKRANEISMATAAEVEEERHEVIDLTKPPAPEPEDEVALGPVQVLEPTRKITMNTTLEDTTYGHGNTRTLEAGRTYILDRNWADHLDRLGFVHH